MMIKMPLVGVYGTLKRGEANNCWLGEAKFVGECKINGTLGWVMPFIPGFKLDGSNQIEFEVFEVEEMGLEDLDFLESHPKAYKRQLVNTIFGEVWVYCWKWAMWNTEFTRFKMEEMS